MASGCIIDTCMVCDELIWEDEPYHLREDRFIHVRCFKKIGIIVKEELLTKDIALKEIERLKETLNFVSGEVERLERLINEKEGEYD